MKVRRRKNATLLERRVEWMLSNHNLWYAWPRKPCLCASCCVYVDRMRRYCAAGLKAAKLYAPSTCYLDIRFERLVALARERMRN